MSYKVTQEGTEGHAAILRTDRHGLMEATLYHGSDDKELDTDAVNPMRGRFDLCLTSDREIAATYGEHVHEIEFEGYCSTPADVVEVADEHGLNDGPQRIDEDSPYFYLLLDDERVQDALVEEGHEAVRFEDENLDNEIHETIRVLDPSCIQ